MTLRKNHLGLLLATALLSASVADAQGARGRSRADEIAEEEARKAREERENRVPEVVQEKAREKVEVKTGGEATYVDFRRQTEQKMAGKRKELIDQLDAILKQNPPEAEKPELLFQKAELFLEEAQFHFFTGMQLDDKIATALDRGDEKAVLSLNDKKDKSLEESKKWAKDAIKIFEQIAKKYRKYERMPDVLYALGQAYWDAQNYKEALKVYRALIKDHPKSQYIPDAWLAFGEYYFQVSPEDERDVQKALDAYIKAASQPDSPVFGYATYKQGWCYYNLTRHDKSAEKFKEVVLYSSINKDLLGTRKIGLAREARKDYVLAYSQYGTGQAAPGEFKQIAEGEELKKMLERLADIYYGDGKDRDAIIVYQTLMKMEPENTRNPLYQGKIVKLASRIGEKRQVVGQARKLGDEYKRVRAVFANLKDGDPKKEIVAEDLRQADDISDNTLRFLATTWHNEAKKTRDDSTFEYAYELYGDYLSLFPDRKEAYEIRFFYAELLYKLEKFEQAGEQYLKVYTIDPKGKWAEASAEEAVRAYDEVVKDYDRANKPQLPTGADALKERPIPDVKKKYVAACKNYTDNYPNGKIVIEARYKVARVLYDYNYFKDATPRFMEIVNTHAEHPRAEQSANLVLDTYNILEDWKALNEAARAFLANKPLVKNEEFRAVVLRVLEESTFKMIAEYEKAKAWEEAAKRYLAFTDEFPKSTLADKALANSATLFTRAGQLDRAIKVRMRLINEFKESPLVPDQIFAVAAAYEQIIDYKKAAEWLEKFVDTYPKDARSRDALFNASIYRQGTADPKQAVADREKYLKTFPTAPDAEDVAYSIPVCWEEANDYKKAIVAYQEFAKEWRKKNPARALNAEYKALRLLEKTKNKRDYEKAMKDLEAASNGYRKSGKPIDDVGDPLAIVAFQQADEIFVKFKELKIAKPDSPKDFQKTLKAKRDAGENVYKAYTEVVKLKSPEWAVASLFRIGEAQAHLVKAIGAVPPPKGLTEEQSQLFKDKLGEMALPIDEQAAQSMELCLTKSAELGVFNEWTRKCLGYLEENRPTTYPKNSVEQLQRIEVKLKKQERGVGLVLALPNAGEDPVADTTTAPPPPPDVAPDVPGSAVAAPGKPDMDFSDEGGGQ